MSAGTEAKVRRFRYLHAIVDEDGKPLLEGGHIVDTEDMPLFVEVGVEEVGRVQFVRLMRSNVANHSGVVTSLTYHRDVFIGTPRLVFGDWIESGPEARD